MDLKKIFLKDACPTSVGGQAVMEGIMMRGLKRSAVAVRLPDGRIHIKTEPNTDPKKIMKMPVARGVAAFLTSLIQGTKTLMYSADVLEDADASSGESEDGEDMGRIETFITEKFGEKALWNIMIYLSVVLAIAFSVVVFVLLPTVVVSGLQPILDNHIALNFIEGILRLIMFVIYIALISRMEDIKRVFQYHGAEHKTIHCFENNLELTPENAQKFYTLHPRCGTSFLMFVMVISLVLFSLLGWPNLIWRILSRVLLIPVVAGLSYELLKWAGRSDSWLVKVLSMPGLYLQKLTTKEPDNKQLEVAIVALKAVMVEDDSEYIEGICDLEGNLIEPHKIKQKNLEEMNEPCS